MRWTAENENLLWRTIFQTQTLTLELDKVSEAWPGDDKPTPKAIKERLDKNRQAGTNVTFSMGPKNGAAASPRKPRTTKKPTTTSASPPVNGAETGTRTPNGTATGTGRGRGRPRKTPANANNALKDPDLLEPPSKKIKTEDLPTFEIQVPVSPAPSGVIDKKNADPGVNGIHNDKEHAVNGHDVAKHVKENKVPTKKPSTTSAKEIKVENTEEYANCGQEIDCKGACCGEPRCLHCFGEWKGEF